MLFVAKMVQMVNKYILSKTEACQTEKILNIMSSTPCPQPQNVIDCGLFAVSMCIHILEGKADIMPTWFTSNVNTNDVMSTWFANHM